ncbi:MAG TPA: hypothetical protein VJS44_00255 [Pyrinomonadaceae bacterium]|nr:hypothetical protein [Pyrinomonadaceae bacterium]
MKKFFALAFVSALLVASLSVGASGQQQQQTASKSAGDERFFPLEQVKPGMKGVAWTVFEGSEPEKIDVEILGVLPGFMGPRQSAIIARLSGPKIEKTNVFGGMSGSPVYIDGRLVGAISFNFPFGKEPIGGITPIKQMIDIFERNSAGGDRNNPQEPRSISFTQLASTEWKPVLPKPVVTGAPLVAPVSAGSPLVPLLGQQFAPIATPVVFGGISQEALAKFSPQLIASGLMPVAGVGGAASITPLGKITEKTLAPGTSISVQLVRGDYSIAASGTVTYRDGNRIYAFGHPFLSLGSSDMPMTEASVVTVISNANSPFKLTVPGQMVGSISQDRATGIYGQLGEAPRMIPVRVQLRTSRDRVETYNYEVANDSFLTPLLLNLTLYNTIASSERGLGESTISVKGQINVRGQKPIQIERRFSATNAAQMASGSIAVPMQTLLSSGFENVDIGGVTVDISSSDTKYTGTLERVSLDRTEARRGETVEVQAYVRTESGKQFVQRIPVEIPSDIPTGQLILFVGDGNSLQQAAAAQNFVPQDLGQLVHAINNVKKNDRLYVKLYRVTPGAVIGTSEMPNLPPSVVATLNSDRASGGYTQTNLSPIYERELPPAEFVISGQQLIAIEVQR